MSDRNAYFRLNIKQDGMYIVLVPPKENGASINFSELDEYLTFRKIEYDKKKIVNAINSLQTSVELFLAKGTFLPENESVNISMDLYKEFATARFYPPSNQGKRLTREDIISELVRARIKYGAQSEVIAQFLEDPMYCTDYVVARAILPVEGKHAEIRYFFNTDLSLKPKTNDDGSVDFHQLDNISHVYKGDLLAELIPAVQGKPGIDVCGAVIRPNKVNNKALRFGRNISFNEDRTKIFSEVDGHVKIVDDQVFVSDTYEIPADVDASTGDITYEGNVLVKGNVRTGFSIRAKGDIIVNGVVEGALLEADGQIILKRGIQGMNRGMLKAGSNVVSKFIESATIAAGGYVSTDAILHSKISSKGDITASGQKGLITGGELHSATQIHAKTAGSPMGTTTVLEVGIDPNVLEEHRRMEKEIAELQAELEKQNQQLTLFARKLKNGEKLPPEKLSLIKSTAEMKAETEQKIFQYTQKYNAFELEMENNNKGCVRIADTIYPGCKIIISGVVNFIRKPAQHCRLVKDQVDIRFEPY